MEWEDEEIEITDSTEAEPVELLMHVPHRLLSKQEEIDLITAAHNGDIDARNKVVECNMRLVTSIAKKFSCRTLTMEDMIQEGVFGLIAAIEKFDTGKGFRFSTYSTYWIRQAITRAIEKTDRIIRLPTHGWSSERRIKDITLQLEEELGRHPTTDELSEATGVPSYLIYSYQTMVSDPLSLNVLIGDSHDSEFVDVMPNLHAVNPEMGSLQQHDKSTLMRAIDEVLNEREKRVVHLRFGFEGNRVYTLREIGEEMRVSRERVRQLERDALKKIKKVLSHCPGFQSHMLSSSVLYQW